MSDDHMEGTRPAVDSLIRHFRWLLLLIALPAMSAEPDWQAVQSRALATLSSLIKIDTSQPQGNEIAAAQFIADQLWLQGIASEIVAAKPGRTNIVARLQGSGTYKPLLLLGHLDVVSADPEQWSLSPFSGQVAGGKIHGRGAVDAKSIVVAGMQMLLLVKQMGLQLNRDLIFLAVADEENGGELGISYMLKKYPDLIQAEFAINEGGQGFIDPASGKHTRFSISTAEKIPHRARLTARGMAGHGSVPTSGNPIIRLAKALITLTEARQPMRLNATTREFFRRLAVSSPPTQSIIYRQILGRHPSVKVQKQLEMINPAYGAMLRTTIVPTIIRGGVQRNVIPGEAEAILDIRTLPGENPQALFTNLQQLVFTPGITITPLKVTRPDHQPAPLDNLLYKTLEKIIRERHPEALILPSMSIGASDSAQLRAAGIPTYGFGPAVIAGEYSGIHGNNEFLSIDAFNEYIRILWAVVQDVATD